jgi:hypothetical protein
LTATTVVVAVGEGCKHVVSGLIGVLIKLHILGGGIFGKHVTIN